MEASFPGPWEGLRGYPERVPRLLAFSRLPGPRQVKAEVVIFQD